MSNRAKEKKGISRRDFIKVSAAATAVASAAGMVHFLSPRPSYGQTPSGTITVVTSADANSYDPHSWISDDGRMIGAHIFESLVTRDYQPMLATSWENPDKNTWVFRLRKGVEFTDGEAFDASVVKFNLQRYMDPETKALFRGLMEPVESVEEVDKYTVKIRTKTPYSVLIYVLRDIHMMSPKAVKEFGKDIVRKPVGTGPFVFKEWTPMERTVIEANPNYHGPKAKVKTIVWRPVTEPSTRIVELKSGRADMINRVPSELIKDISGEGMKVLRRQSIWRMGIMLNCGKPPFDKVKVRQAFNYAANKEDLIKYILNGAGYVMGDPLGPDVEGHNPNVKPYPFDPAMSKKLLAEAGYPNGVEVEILTPAGRYLKDKELVEAVSAQVKEGGFNMKAVAMEWGMFLKNYKNLNGFFIGEESPYAQRYFSKNMDSRVKSYAWMGYHNEEFNKLLDEAGETFDAQKRNAIYQKLSKMVFDDGLYLYMYYDQLIYGVRDRIKGFTPRADGFILLTDASIS
jgi:peptide/nickel transport system substrate-binding protein